MKSSLSRIFSFVAAIAITMAPLHVSLALPGGYIEPPISGGGGIELPTGTGLSDKTILEIVTFVLQWLLTIFLIIAIISFVITGIQFIMAFGGSYSDSYRNAKDNFKYSILAIIVVGSSLIILKTIDYLLKAGSTV